MFSAKRCKTPVTAGRTEGVLQGIRTLTQIAAIGFHTNSQKIHAMQKWMLDS